LNMRGDTEAKVCQQLFYAAAQVFFVSRMHKASQMPRSAPGIEHGSHGCARHAVPYSCSIFVWCWLEFANLLNSVTGRGKRAKQDQELPPGSQANVPITFSWPCSILLGELIR
jgi:hypothetical protein